MSYAVTSGGSVVKETLFPGKPHEMITMYYMDGNDLVLVHYCGFGNQPRMKAEPGSDPAKLPFKFAGGANIDPAKDSHMHEVEFVFVSAKEVRATWQTWVKGKVDHAKEFHLKRKAAK